MDNKIKDNVLGKLIIMIWVILFMLSACGIMIEASTTETITPQVNQYFELKATKINKVDSGRQVIMELWGYNIDFKRIRSKI